MPFYRLIFDQQEWIDLYYHNCTLKSVEEWNASGGKPDVLLGVIWMTIGIFCEVAKFNVELVEMPFYRLIFDHQEWIDLYYHNCTLKSVEEWNASGGKPDVLLGTIWMTIGIFCELTYLPFMVSMASEEFIIHPAYKLMFVLGIVDMITLPCNAIYFGMQTVLGLHYCNNPLVNYIVGGISMSGWYTASVTCCVLAVDRFFEICFPRVGKILFGGKRAFYWIAFCIGYLLFYWTVSMPLIYSNKFRVALYDPFVGSEFGGNPWFYDVPLMIFDNAAVVVFLGVTYGILCVVITYKSIKYKGIEGMTKLQKIMLLQSMAICWEMFFVAIVYGLNEIYPNIPEFFTKMEHIAWLCVHGDTPIIYVLLNASLRQKFFSLIKNYTKKTGNTMFHLATSIYPTQIHPHSRIYFLSDQTQPQSTNPNAPIPSTISTLPAPQ